MGNHNNIVQKPEGIKGLGVVPKKRVRVQYFYWCLAVGYLVEVGRLAPYSVGAGECSAGLCGEGEIQFQF